MQLSARAAAAAGLARAGAGDLPNPVSTDEFAALMAALGPFERHPRLGVAVSGGRDSLALALLAADWARARQGAVRALIVDHGLRAESGAEARLVSEQLARGGIDAEILPWLGAKPATGVSARARAARYGLLEARCRELGILHLLLGHQRQDQAETVLLRLGDGSGPEGLAGIAAIVERSDLRLLRPLLGVDRSRLADTVASRGLRWIDDPSNQRADFARIAARQAIAGAAGGALSALSMRFGGDRASIEVRISALLVDIVSVDPAGFAWCDLTGLTTLPDQVALRLIGRLAACFGGRHYRARRAGLAKALAGLRDGSNAAAGGCRFLIRGQRVLVCREAGAITAPVPVPAAGGLVWDGRYEIAWRGAAAGALLGPLGRVGRREALANGLSGLRGLPAAVGEALPALWRPDGQVMAVFLPLPEPNARLHCDGRWDIPAATVISGLAARFRPAQALAPASWPLVLPPGKPM